MSGIKLETIIGQSIILNKLKTVLPVVNIASSQNMKNKDYVIQNEIMIDMVAPD